MFRWLFQPLGIKNISEDDNVLSGGKSAVKISTDHQAFEVFAIVLVGWKVR